MGSRLSLHDEFVAFMSENNITPHVYFQPPKSVQMIYPCIVYERAFGSTSYANDMPYNYTQSYTVTVIDPDPDSILIPKLAMRFPTIKYNRHFVNDNLNHDVYSLFY